jgi:hypothetical protein
VIVAALAAVGLLLRDVGKQARIRIVHSGREDGVLMAVDADGLRQLNDFYSLPTTCTATKMRTTPIRRGSVFVSSVPNAYHTRSDRQGNDLDSRRNNGNI